MKKETRILEHPLTVTRAAEGESGPGKIEGTAVVYDEWSVDLGGFRERIMPGAFGNLSNRDIVAQAHHEGGMSTIGRTPDSLKLRDSKKDLSYRVNLPDTTASRDLVAQMEAGIVKGSSFTFRVKAGGEKIEEDKDGNITRTVNDAELFEVAPVVHPAYPQTDVAMRSVDAFRKEAENTIENEARQRSNEAELMGMSSKV